MDRGRLPDEEEADLFRVPDSAAGAGFVPSGSTDRWLDGTKVSRSSSALACLVTDAKVSVPCWGLPTIPRRGLSAVPQRAERHDDEREPGRYV